jgi:ATP-dependent DNA helicase RecG
MQAPRQLSLFEDPSFFESVDIEFKAGRGGLPASLWETYSAFANTNGGTIYLGVVEKEDSLDVQGVPDSEKMRSDLWNTVNNRGKVSVNLLTTGDVQIVEVQPGKQLLKVNVPRANRTQRPVFLNNNPFGGTFKRDHTGDYRCTEEEVRRMFADQSSEPADSRVLPEFTMTGIHAPSLAQYRNRMAATTPSHPRLGEDDRSLLAKLGGWRRDRTRGTEGLTVAGLLMFGLEPSIRAAEATPHYHLDY